MVWVKTIFDCMLKKCGMIGQKSKFKKGGGKKKSGFPESELI